MSSLYLIETDNFSRRQVINSDQNLHASLTLYKQYNAHLLDF